MKGIIYRATNSYNGKVYIGQTITSLKHRRSEHLRDAVSDSVNHFHLALMQYGKDAFEWDILDEFSGSREDVIHALNVAEEYHILTTTRQREAIHPISLLNRLESELWLVVEVGMFYNMT